MRELLEGGRVRDTKMEELCRYGRVTIGISGTFTIARTMPKLIVLVPTASETVLLPNPAATTTDPNGDTITPPTDGLTFIIVNGAAAAYTLTVKDYSNTNTVAVIPENGIGIVYCDGTNWWSESPSGAFAGLTASGDTALASTLEVGLTATFSSNVSIASTLALASNLTVGSTVSLASNLSVSKDLLAASTLEVGSTVSLSSTLSVAKTLAAQSNATVASTLVVSSAVSLSSGLVVGSAATNLLGFYGSSGVSQRTASTQTSSNAAVSSSFGATQLAILQEIMNTLTGLGMWKGS